jgi:tetratricopeptide (TPR) repeat protein
MGSGASTLSAEPGSAAPFAYDPLAEPMDRKKMPELGVDLTQIAESAAALITAAEAHRDELLEGTGNFETRCDELRDSMQLEAMVTLLRGAEESAATLTQLAAALLGATGEAKDALATVDKALELAADDNEALFNAHTERGLVLLAQQQAEPAA